MENNDQLACPLCDSAMELGSLILGSSMNSSNLFFGLLVRMDGKLVWRDKMGNISKAIVGRDVKIPSYRCGHCGLVAFKMQE